MASPDVAAPRRDPFLRESESSFRINAQWRRDLLVALSLANLCYVRVWGTLLNPANGYFLDRPPSWIGAVVASIGMLALSAVFFAGSRIARRARPGSLLRHIASLALLAALAVAANALRQQAPGLSFEALSASLGRLGFWLVSSVGALLAAEAWLRWGTEGLARRSTTLVLVLLPFTLLTLGQAVLLGLRSRSDALEFRDKNSPSLLRAVPFAPRLLFLVFDGLDQQLLTDARPADLALQEFDAFFETSVQWNNAYPPSNNTGVSLPALITGRDVVRVRRAAANELMLSYADSGRETPWSLELTLFTRARELRRNSALIGWYHPYCRILGDDVARCHWYPYVQDPSETLSGSVFLQMAFLVDTIPGAFRFGLLDHLGGGWARGSADPSWHAKQYGRIHEQALQASADKRFQFIFVHYPIPHNPFIYDRHSETVRLDGKSRYIDNLALADRTLRELRQRLQVTGLWDSTALLITSDHWFPRGHGEFAPTLGKPEHRVPLTVRLPGQTEAVVRYELLRTHAAHYLSLAILEGSLRTPADLDHVLHQLPRWIRASP